MSNKPFKTYAELVSKLKDEKQLEVPDEQRVIELLKTHSYFSLISGYKSLFKNSDGKYKPGTTIEDILALFEFDNQLRNIFFQAIQSIEKHIKSVLSYAFCQKYGDSQDAYLCKDNFAFIGVSSDETYFRCAEVKRLTQTFKDIVTPPYSQSYIEHQHRKHRNIPLWVAIKAVTFGTTSKMYSLCTPDIQTAVSKEFPGVAENQLEGMLDFLTRVRNVCAHNERLYSFKTDKKRAIQVMPIHSQLKIGKKKSYFNKGQDDLFAAVICFKYLLPSAEFQRVCDALNHEISDLCGKTKQFQKNKILSCMGFPENWLDIKK